MSSRRGPPLSDFAPPYVGASLCAFESAHYKAAGVLPLARGDDGEVRQCAQRPSKHTVARLRRIVSPQALVLLGTEFRAEYGRYAKRGHFLAGKRDRTDDGPEWTAWREFFEETGSMLTDAQRDSFMSRDVSEWTPGLGRVHSPRGRQRARWPCAWVPSGKFVLYAFDLGASTPDWADLPRRYAACVGTAPHAEMLSLHWFRLRDVVDYLADQFPVHDHSPERDMPGVATTLPDMPPEGVRAASAEPAALSRARAEQSGGHEVDELVAAAARLSVSADRSGGAAALCLTPSCASEFPPSQTPTRTPHSPAALRTPPSQRHHGRRPFLLRDVHSGEVVTISGFARGVLAQPVLRRYLEAEAAISQPDRAQGFA